MYLASKNGNNVVRCIVVQAEQGDTPVVNNRSPTDLRLAAMDAQSPQVAAILVTVADWLEGQEQHKEPLHERIAVWADRCATGCRVKAAVTEFIAGLDPNY